MAIEIDVDRKILLEKWDSKLGELFGGSIPEHSEWNTPAAIASVLQTMAGHDTHLFLPGGGGEDLAQCRIAHDQMIEWSPEIDRLDSYAHVASPLKLTFWNPELSGHDANFILEVGALSPVSPTGLGSEDGVEEVVELRKGQYAPRSSWDNSEFNGNPLPATSRLLVRYTAPSRFALFSKGSIYNRFSDPTFDGYGGHHNDPIAFRKIVEEFSKVDL